MNCSPSPRPMISGHSLRAPTSKPGLVRAHRDERVVAAQLGVGAAHRLDEVAVVVVRDQVRDHLGIGLGGELGALCDQPALERDVVLDDPVDDDVDPVGGVEVGVGVLLGDPAVGRPARVADAGPRLRPLGDRDRAATAAASCRPPQAAIAPRSALRLPTARTASIRSPSSTEIPALS